MRIFSRIASFFTIPITILLLILIIEKSRSPKTSPVIPVDFEAAKWDSNIDPIVITQLSDLHVSTLRMNTTVQWLRDSLAYIAENVNSTFTLLTGDLTDNLETTSVWSPAHPIKAYWELYKQIMHDECPVDKDRVIEVLGNHDCWGRVNFDDEYYDYLLHPHRDSWMTQTYERDGIRVISWVPIKFPVGRTAYLYVIPLYPSMLDALEDALEKPTTCETTIVASHFTTSMMYPLDWVRSKSGRNLAEILENPKYKVRAFLNGHTHPKNTFRAVHTGHTIEITCTALLDGSTFGIFTLDNGRLSYTTVPTGHDKPAIVTSPGRDELATRIFADQTFQIRVLSFTESGKEFHVSGDVEGELRFVRKTSSGADLYAMDVTLPEGHYSIKISGDLDEVVNFSVGVPAGPFTEKPKQPLKGGFFFSFCIIGFVYQLFVLIFMFFMPSRMQIYFENMRNWICGAAVQHSWLSVVFAGPFFTWYCLYKLPKKTKALLVWMIASPLIIPFSITKIEQSLCFQYFSGYVIEGHYRYDAIAQCFGLFYWLSLCIGFEIIYALFSLKPSKTMIIDVILSIGVVAVSLVIYKLYDDDSYVHGTILRVSYGFHLMPVFMLLSAVHKVCSTRKSIKNE